MTYICSVQNRDEVSNLSLCIQQDSRDENAGFIPKSCIETVEEARSNNSITSDWYYAAFIMKHIVVNLIGVQGGSEGVECDLELSNLVGCS
jgi:hypothetical protein